MCSAIKRVASASLEFLSLGFFGETFGDDLVFDLTVLVFAFAPVLTTYLFTVSFAELLGETARTFFPDSLAISAIADCFIPKDCAISIALSSAAALKLPAAASNLAHAA